MQLDPAAAAAGCRLISHDIIGSTNEDAIQRARAGERGPLWVTAARQSAGRGRRGREWVSELGNLYASLLLTDAAPHDRAPELSFVAALAVHDAIAGRIRGLDTRLALKWPNDLLIDGCKFAGILIEGEGAAIVIGIGINCTRHPTGTEFPATDLAAAGVRASPDTVFAALSLALPARIAQWDCGAGFAAIRADWLSRAAGRGKAIRVKLADGERSGQFDTIDDTGRLILRLADGATQAITAGDVAFAARS